MTTGIATTTPDDVFVGEKRLCGELIGKLAFTEMTCFQVLGRLPTSARTAVLDACLVTLMEHGLTRRARATRLVHTSAPEAMQATIAAGLLGVGSLFAGTVAGAAALIVQMLQADDGVGAEAQRIAGTYRAARRPVPGFGHPVHKPDDARGRGNRRARHPL